MATPDPDSDPDHDTEVESDPETAESDARTTKQARLDNPSGVLHLTRHEAVPVLLDALLDWPPDREFTVTEFADHAGVVRQTVSKHVDLLVEVGLVERLDGTNPQRYRLADGPATRELFAFNSALNADG